MTKSPTIGSDGHRRDPEERSRRERRVQRNDGEKPTAADEVERAPHGQYSSRSRVRKSHVSPSTPASTMTNHTTAIVDG